MLWQNKYAVSQVAVYNFNLTHFIFIAHYC